jgi:hypothetical protein
MTRLIYTFLLAAALIVGVSGAASAKGPKSTPPGQAKAQAVRNPQATMKRHATLVGTITAIDGLKLTLSVKGRAVQTVTLTDSTVVTNRDDVALVSADLAVGHRVRVKGEWNKSAKTITATAVKDFSLPVK